MDANEKPLAELVNDYWHRARLQRILNRAKTVITEHHVGNEPTVTNTVKLERKNSWHD